jgi:hypothetical protein
MVPILAKRLQAYAIHDPIRFIVESSETRLQIATRKMSVIKKSAAHITGTARECNGIE